MLYHPEHKIGFLHNPKTAGISLTKYLQALGFIWDVHPDLPWSYAPSFVNRHAYHPPDAMYGEDANLLPDWKIFTVVRHPYARCLSNWRYQVEHELIPSELESLPSFSTYLDDYDRGLPTQVLYVNSASHTLRYETLVTDLMDFDPLFMDAHRLLGFHNVTNSNLFAADLSWNNRHRIYTTRRSEFDTLGYKP